MMGGHDDYDGERLLPLDATCPYCRQDADVDEVFDGSERRCGNCGKRVTAVAWTDDTMSLIGTERPPQPTGRQRTRALWRKRGRR